MASRNENVFTSSIPQPSRSASPNKPKLSEVSASGLNARSQAMGPPAKTASRRTLVERAGEIAKPGPPPNFRPGSAHAHATSLNGIQRNTSMSSNGSSRSYSSASTRVTSNSSYGNSVGPGHRPPSLSSFRSRAEHGNPRLKRSVQGRPASAILSHHEESPSGQVLGKRKGRVFFPSIKESFAAHTEISGLQETQFDTSDSPPEPRAAVSLRDISIAAALGQLSLDDNIGKNAVIAPLPTPKTPSSIPKLVPAIPRSPSSSPYRSPSRSPRKMKSQPVFLNKETNLTSAWDFDERFEEIEDTQRKFTEVLNANLNDQKGLAQTSEIYKSRVTELETLRDDLTSRNRLIQAELDFARTRIASVVEESDEQKRSLNKELEDSNREHRRELDDVQRSSEDQRRKLLHDHAEELDRLQRTIENQLADERAYHEREIERLHSDGAHSQKEIERELEGHLSALKTIEDDLERTRSDIARERELNNDLRDQLANAARREADLERSVQRLEGHIQFLESDNKSQSHAFADLESRMQKAIRDSEEAKTKLINEETLRRKLHNQVQELKGNIRVFCRVRPALRGDEDNARINYPDDEVDAKEVEIMGPEEKSSLGTITTRKHAFSFDKVFGPAAQNPHVFDEISQLVQSALDGYNVCIFCYGQTGSGKTFTMSSADGMIPLAVNQIYSTAKSLEEKGWKYTMSGSFIEVYNENLNDLLGKAEDFDKKKHEIRHDMQKSKTEVTGMRTVELDSPGRVEDILRNANRNRTVAATQANERSSRSHSVFILKLNGENSVTGERSEGTLNLVDLAGSERLSHSGATGDRLKETQNINKSLSCLGDVIGALGQGKEGGHIPYRNSKLTYLLQFSLGGNSKTLMFVMISPLQAHLSETLTSLKFATKVHNTHIGTARKQVKTKD